MEMEDLLAGSGVAAFVMIILVAVAIGIVIKIFYLLTLQRAMDEVDPERRAMPSGQVWLELIPLFNIVWQFFNVNNVTRSLENEFAFRGMPTQEITQAATLGKTFCILSCCSFVPFVGGLAGLGSLICWIIFWVKISNLKGQLQNYKLHKIDYIQ